MQSDCRDRTSEFFKTCKQFSKSRPPHSRDQSLRHNASATPSSSAFSSPESYPLQPAQSDISLKSQFTQAAAQISHGIVSTTHKLEQLAKLAKQTTLFNDPTDDINQLTVDIKDDIAVLNQEIESLERFVQHQKRLSSQQSSDHSQTVVHSLKSKLAGTTQTFSSVLHTRTNSLKSQSDRRKHFSSGSSTFQRNRQRKRRTFQHSSNQDDDDEKRSLLGDDLENPQPQQQQQQQLLAEPEQQNVDYLGQRRDAVNAIERTIAELGSMYQKLSTLVATQQDTMLRIDGNVDATLDNMEAGHGQLLKYYDNISSNRWLIIKVFFTLIMFAIFFTVFVA